MSQRYRIESMNQDERGERRTYFVYADTLEAARDSARAAGLYVVRVIPDGRWDPVRCEIIESSDRPVAVGDVYARAIAKPRKTLVVNGAHR